MFNPHQLQVWSGLLTQNPELDRFDGHPFESVVTKTPPPQAMASDGAFGLFQGPERIFGAAVEPSCLTCLGPREIRLATPKLTREANARVIGFSAALTEDLRLLAPSEITATDTAGFIASNAYNHQGFLFELADGGLRIRFATRGAPRPIPGKTLFLHNLEPGNYGSFVFRQLPQLLLAAEQGLEPDQYIVGDRTPWLGDALRFAGLPSRPVFTIAEVCGDVCEELSIFSGIDNGGFLSQQARSGLSRFKERALGEGGEARPGRQRIYVSRRLSALHRPWYRVMLNEAEVETLLARNGFHIVYPETLALADQVRTFDEAQCVIGPSGSGMFNTAFAPEGSRVLDIETFTYTVAQHAMFYASCRHPYSFLFATPEVDPETPLVHRPYVTPQVNLLAALDWLCAS